MLKLVRVALDGMGATVSAFDDGLRWNGFACPLFSKEQGMAFIAEWNKIRDPRHDGEVSWNSAYEAFFIIEGEEYFEPGRPEVVTATIIGGERYYRIGGMSWCWHLTDLPVAGCAA